MLTDVIREEYPDQDTAFYDRVFEISILYAVKAIGAFEFQKQLNDLLSDRRIKTPSAKAFRLILINQSYFCLNLKFFVLSVVRGRMFSRFRDKERRKRVRVSLAKAVKEYKVKKADFYNLRPVIAAHRDEIAELSLTPMSLGKVKEGFADIHEQVFKYIQSLTYRKLTFVVNSNNLSHQDLHYELLTKALKSYYLLVPTEESSEYIVNYVKRAVHNHAMNLIKSYTFQKRDRLTSTKDKNGDYQFSLKCVSENQERLEVDADSSVWESAPDTNDAIDRIDSEQTERKLGTTYKARLSKVVLNLMLAHEDSGFTAYLKAHKLVRGAETNSDLYARITVNQYKKLVSEYTRVSLHKIDAFLKGVYKKHYGISIQERR